MTGFTIFGIVLGDFLFYIDNGMLCIFIRIASILIRTHNIFSCSRNSKRYPYYASYPGAMINTHKLELPLYRASFLGSEGIRAFEVLLYLRNTTLRYHSSKQRYWTESEKWQFLK